MGHIIINFYFQRGSNQKSFPIDFNGQFCPESPQTFSLWLACSPLSNELNIEAIQDSNLGSPSPSAAAKLLAKPTKFAIISLTLSPVSHRLLTKAIATYVYLLNSTHPKSFEEVIFTPFSDSIWSLVPPSPPFEANGDSSERNPLLFRSLLKH